MVVIGSSEVCQKIDLKMNTEESKARLEAGWKDQYRRKAIGALLRI